MLHKVGSFSWNKSVLLEGLSEITSLSMDIKSSSFHTDLLQLFFNLPGGALRKQRSIVALIDRLIFDIHSGTNWGITFFHWSGFRRLKWSGVMNTWRRKWFIFCLFRRSPCPAGCLQSPPSGSERLVWDRQKSPYFSYNDTQAAQDFIFLLQLTHH